MLRRNAAEAGDHAYRDDRFHTGNDIIDPNGTRSIPRSDFTTNLDNLI